jgi:acetolactate synthase-1/2/3 large subunit
MFNPSSFKRPVVIVGNGCRGADLTPILESGLPIVSSWLGADMVAWHDNHIGHCGIFGDRASNFAVQNSDYLLVLGCRMSVPIIGHNFKLFAREAKIYMVDIDQAEIDKPSLGAFGIAEDVKDFLKAFKYKYDESPWLRKCREWRERYSVLKESGHLPSYKFIGELSEKLPDDAVVVTDMGTAFTCTFQAAKMKKGQRWLTASGHAPMGYGLPGAIGAHYATGKRITCIVGDGSLMFNLQELQTIAHHNLPIDIYLLDNGGYLTMKHTFANHFGRQVGSDEGSGVSFPSWAMVAKTFGVPLTVVKIPHDQPLVPRTSSMKLPDGSITSKPLEDMYPFLPREEFLAQMIVKPAEVYECS